MKLNTLLCLIITIALFSFSESSAQSLLAEDVNSAEAFFKSMESNRQWPSYRGYYASGYLDDAQLPDSFNIASSYKVKWNVEVPGMGLSCPVIWDNRVFISTAVSEQDNEGYTTGIYGDIAPVDDSSEHVWKVLCFEKNSGKLILEQYAKQANPKENLNPKSSHSNNSIYTDGNHVIAFL